LHRCGVCFVGARSSLHRNEAVQQAAVASDLETAALNLTRPAAIMTRDGLALCVLRDPRLKTTPFYFN